MTFKPLLAESVEDLNKVPYPVLVSVKLDGIRAIVKDKVVYSRSMKPIRNKHVQYLFGREEYNGLDGELIVGPPNASDVYLKTNSGVMSADGEPDVKFYVFDRWDWPEVDYAYRLEKGVFGAVEGLFLVAVTQWLANSVEDVLSYEETALNDGYEGLMLRRPDAKYKYGRSTAKEFILMKLKRFTDAEYKVVGFEERMKNNNEATKNELGYTERSTCAENLAGRGDLGALVLQLADGQTFNCGTGFTDEDRRAIWDNRDQYLGQMAKVKSFLIGVKDLPRFPVWLGFRDAIDM